MPYDHLADFLTALEDAGEMVRVRATVDPSLELAAVTGRLAERSGGGPAVLFEQVRGSPLPVAANLLGSSSRLCRALGVESLRELGDRVAGALRPDVPDGVLDSLRLVPRFVELSKLPPRGVKTGACQQIVRMGRDVDLGDLPIPRSWPQENAPVITAGLLATTDPETGRRSLDLAPLEVKDARTLAVHWSRHDAAWRHFARCRREGRQLQCAVVLGGDPALLVAAASPLPEMVDTLLFAGFLRNRGVDVVRCRSHELTIPADAELILEGVIDPALPPEPAGPIALPTGHYSIPTERPLMTVTAVTQRSNPVFPAMISSPPPGEWVVVGRAIERMLLPIVRLFVPEVVEIHQPAAGAGHGLLFVSIRKEHPQQARKVMHALWGLGPLSLTKLIIVVDEEIDPAREDDVWNAVCAQAHPGRDVVSCEGPTHPDDHAAPIAEVGHKLGIDATRKLPEEGRRRPCPDALTMSDEVRSLLETRWTDYGLPG